MSFDSFNPFKMIGAVVQGEAAAGAAEYNAAIARQNAAAAVQQGQAASESQARDAARKIGAMVAGYGASGVSGSTSASDVLADSVRMATLDNLTTKYNYKLRELGFLNEASLQDSNATNSRTAGVLNALGAGMSGYADYTTRNPSAGGGTPIPNFSGIGYGGVPAKRDRGDYNYENY